MSRLTSSDCLIVAGAAFAFWILIPVPFWLFGMALAGELVLWPSFEPDIVLVSTLWVIAFYEPLLLMALIGFDAIRSRARHSEDANKNA